MLFWIICAVMTVLVAAYAAVPLLREGGRAASSPDVDIYKAQLAEIDNDLARDVIDADEAARARVEVSRRLLAASKIAPQSGNASPTANRILGAVVCAGLLAIGFATYLRIGAPGEPDQPLAMRHDIAEQMRENRPSQAELAQAAPLPPQVDAPAEYLDNVAMLRRVVPARPDDLQGWELLAYHEMQLRNYQAAAVAQERVVALHGDAVDLADRTRLLDLLVAAADGIVSPEAEAIARTILDEDTGNFAGLYYIGSMHNQNGRPDIAFRLWRPLVDADPGNFHVTIARAQIENAAIRAGVEYTLPTFVGPDAAQIAAAQDMSEEDRQAMIGTMVAGLADRLANEGGPASDWARLIGAYGVLGDQDNAGAIWLEAQQVFGTDPAAMDVLRAAAQSAGVLQ